MKLDRSMNPAGFGKYALLNLRKNTVEWGFLGAIDEFFVIKLRDKHAQAALNAYVDSVREEDPEFAAEVQTLANRAGKDSPFCKDPD